MPEISVIVPVYNVEKYLRRCIDSILNQTYSDFELILVDDGSPDNCGLICDEYAKKDGRIIVIHQKNGGVSNARNSGLMRARGLYVTFCDSDDYLLPNYLVNLVQAMDSSSSDLVLSGFETEIDGELGKQFCPRKGYADFHTVNEKIDYIISLYHWECWSSLFDLSIIREHKIQFCSTCGNFAEDMCFMFEYLLVCNKVTAIDTCDYRYVIHDGSMMANSKTIVKLDQMNEVSRQFGERFLSLYPDYKKEFAAIFIKF